MSPFPAPLVGPRHDDVVHYAVPGDAPFLERTAGISRDQVFRYYLTRVWDRALPCFTVLGLNPSTADHLNPDNTIRRVVGYARREGCGSICMLNPFAYRARDPKDLIAATDRVGIWNDRTITERTRAVPYVLCGWGANGTHRLLRERIRSVVRELQRREVALRVLELTQDGEPGHPLMLESALRPVPWKGYE